VLATVKAFLLWFSLSSMIEAVTGVGSGRSEGKEAGRHGGE
jgi:hypothetical protein